MIAATSCLVAFLAGCADDGSLTSRPAAASPMLAQVGPRCELWQATKDPEGAAYAAIIDYVDENGAGEVGSRYRLLTRGQQLLWATLLLEAEIDNGGLNQYFFNTNGATLTEAIEGYGLFGTAAHVRLARSAARLHARDAARLASARAEGTVEAFMSSYDSQPYETLDRQYQDLGPPPGRLEYLKTHPRQFCVP